MLVLFCVLAKLCAHTPNASLHLYERSVGFASVQSQQSVHFMRPCIACPARCPDYLHLHKHRQPRTIPRQALPHTWLMNALLVSHPSETLGVQYRASLPVPCQRELACGKARIYQIQPSLRDTRNAQITQNLSAARLRDRRPDYLPSHKHRQPRTIPPKNQASAFTPMPD